MLAAKWLPHEDRADPDVLARAGAIEKRHWEDMSTVVQNGIARAFKKS